MLSVFFSFSYIALIVYWFPIVIAAREVFMVAYRLLLKSRGKDMKTSIYGKVKTIFQFGFIFALFGVLFMGEVDYELTYAWKAALLYFSWLVVFVTWSTALHYVWVNSIKKRTYSIDF